jgi:hypothetical protein
LLARGGTFARHLAVVVAVLDRLQGDVDVGAD